MAVTFDTLKPDARIFLELNNNPHWWNRFKEDSSLYIEVRKDNQVNVYFEGGSEILQKEDVKFSIMTDF